MVDLLTQTSTNSSGQPKRERDAATLTGMEETGRAPLTTGPDPIQRWKIIFKKNHYGTGILMQRIKLPPPK